LIEKYEKNNQFKEKSVILNNLLEVAVLENKCEFVSLLLKYGVMLSEFLGFGKDNNRLKLLYNNESVSCFFSNVL
jgi:hypothetical protein